MSEEKRGCVYFFKHIGLDPIKIGYSSNESPIGRFDQFKTYAPFGAELLGFIITPYAKDLETKMHKKYKTKRLKGEWFDLSIKDVENEIKFHSDIEDARIKNEFQIAWAKENNTISNIDNNLYSFISSKRNIPNNKLAIIVIKKFPNISKLEIALSLGISRTTLYKYIKLEK